MEPIRYWNDLSKDERIERWEQAVRVLQDLSEHERKEHFNMSVWGMHTACGTVACIAGHCALDPWFQERGWKFVDDPIRYEDMPDGVWYLRTRMAPPDFFGQVGTEWILLRDDLIQTVPQAIEAIQRYIADMRAGTART